MLQLKRISKIYKTKKGVSQLALNEVDLTFADSGLYFIVGPSGCGKSTMMNIIGGMDNFSSGEFIIDGKSSVSFKPRDFDNYRNKKIGVVFQNFNLLKELNIKDNIKLSMQMQNKKISDEEIVESIEQVGLVANMLKRMPTQLSGGQQQRIAIARALIKKPQIILADEPTGNLDQTNSIQIFDLLKDLAKDKLVIVVTHNLQLAKRYADTLIIMQDGRVKKIASRKATTSYAPTVPNAETATGGSSEMGGAIARVYPTKDKRAVLSFSKKLAFAFLILKKNWFKTVLLFIMFTFSITMAGVGITASRYDKVATTLNTYTEAKVFNYYLGDGLRYALNADGYEENRTEGSTEPYINTYLSQEKQADLNNNVGADKLVPFYASDMYRGTFGDVEYLVPLDEANMTKLGYKLLGGRLPTNENEIALSHESYKRLALQFFDTQDMVMIGKMLRFEGTKPVGVAEKNDKRNKYYQTYEIVGFVDTGLKAYESLCKKSYKVDDKDYEYNWRTAYQTELNSGKHCLAFFTPSFFNEKYLNMQESGLFVQKYDKEIQPGDKPTYYQTQLFGPYNYKAMQSTFAGLNGGKNLIENLQMYSLKGIDELKDNEIICNFSTMKNVFSFAEGGDGGVGFNEYQAVVDVAQSKSTENQVIINLANRTIKDSQAVLDSPLTSVEAKQKATERIAQANLDIAAATIKIKEATAEMKVAIERYSEIMNSAIFANNGVTYKTKMLHDWKSERQLYRGNEEVELKIVGFYFPIEDGADFGAIFENAPLKQDITTEITEEVGQKLGNAFASDSLYRKLTYNTGIASYMMTTPDINDMNYISSNNYSIELLYEGDLKIADLRADTLKNVSMWLSIAFGLISLFLMANYFISTVRENQKQVGVLRAMGASVGDTMGIFLLEGIFIAIMVSALAIGFIFPMTYLLEGKINLAFLAPIFPSAQAMATASSKYAISLIKTLTVSWQELVAMAGISFVFAAVFTIIPLLIMLNKKPVEMLRRK